MVIDCTDIEVAAPSLVSQQNATYSGYRSMNSFKGHCRTVAPNAVITYVSKLYPGAIFDKDCTSVGIIESFCAWGYDYGRQGFSNSRYSAKWCFF